MGRLCQNWAIRRKVNIKGRILGSPRLQGAFKATNKTSIYMYAGLPLLRPDISNPQKMIALRSLLSHLMENNNPRSCVGSIYSRSRCFPKG